MKVSIVIPVYNEKNYILKTLEKVKTFDLKGLDKEIIVVDDGSTDGTKEILKKVGSDYKIIFHHKNHGKGAALKTGFKNCTGEIIAIQDADLEYNPDEIPKLIALILAGQTEVVYGSRMMGKNPIGHWRYYLGNKLISFCCNFLYQGGLTDIETGQKVFLRQVLEKISLEQADFGFEVELTAKILKNKITILELPVGYLPRRFSEGKKINWLDGIKALWLLVKYRFS